MAATLNVEFRLDEQLTIDAVLAGISGSAVSLSGLSSADISWGIAQTQESTYIARLIEGDGITVTGSTSGQIRIAFASSYQSELTPGRYYHECRLEHSEGVSIQFAGKARIYDSIFASTAS